MEEVMGYITCIHGSQWWVAQVLEKDSDNGEQQVEFTLSTWTQSMVQLSPTPNILRAPITDILTVVEPRTKTGHSYSLTQNESKAATQKLKHVLNN